MEYIANPFRGKGLDHPELVVVPWPLSDAGPPMEAISGCPRAAVTPLLNADDLASDLGLGHVFIKDERARMGLGSFKALGAAYVIACDAVLGTAKGASYVTASAGNHGMSVAAGAAAFGAKAVVYIAKTVPEAFADRLRDIGADVRREGQVYEESMRAAANAASAEDMILLSDSSWAGYTARPHRLMEGYLILMAEAVAQMPHPPTHIFLQAGVGGLAAAAAAHARRVWGNAPHIVVVEPENAPALAASIRAAGPVIAEGPVSAMGRLDCKEPSLIALKGLAWAADRFMLISEAEGAEGARKADEMGFASTPSGAAGLAGLLAAGNDFGLDPDSSVLLVLSEGPEA